MATLKDVARLAGVSPATASLALNNKPVNRATMERVIECARALNYVPNRSGRSLITGKSGVVLLIILNTREHADLIKESSFFYYIIRGILRGAEASGYSLQMDVREWEDPELRGFFQRKVREKSVEGIIIVPQYIKHYLFLESLTDFPAVYLNPWTTDHGLVSVTVDHHAGGSLVADLFAKNRYTDVAVIHGPQSHHDAVVRREGFLSTLAGHGISVPPVMQYHGEFNIESGYKGMVKILGEHVPRAVFCADDYMAAGALRALYHEGLRVPEDVSVVGYDGIDIARAVYPRLTTVDAGLETLGDLLFDQLLGLIQGTLPANRVHRLVVPDLTAGDTCPVEL